MTKTASRACRVRCPRAGSSAAEHGTFNPLVVGSNPTRLALRSGFDGEIRRQEIATEMATVQ